MSERSKGDVSSRVNNNASRVVKNPLLSASVTGLSFDDFPNKPLLLPAAPPVVHAPPPQATNALIAGILNREPKALVTVGQPSSIDDSEALDEINLNASSSDDSATANASLNPYQSRADANANPLLEPPLAPDSLLSQAASSFGALPSVASNVFSTFSKRIYAGTRDADEAASAGQPQVDIQPSYIQQAGQTGVAPPPFYAAPPALVGEGAPEPPKFYAPTEVSNIATAALPGPPPTAGQNTYRISARKKLYAPIPGLSEQQQAYPAADPFQAPQYPAQPAAAAYEPPPPPVQEERKAGGLFSLTNLVPTGVLQNISGLVQSATGRSSEPPAAAPAVNYNAPNPAEAGSYFQISSGVPQPQANYFAPAPAAPPPAAGYFVPNQASPAVGSFFNPSGVGVETSAAPTVGGFFTPAAQPPTAAQAPVAPPKEASQNQAFSQPPAVSQPPAGTATPTVPPTVAQIPTFPQPPTGAQQPGVLEGPPAVWPPATASPTSAAPPQAAAPPAAGPPPPVAGAPPTAAAPPASAAPPPAAGPPPPAAGPPPPAARAPPTAAPPPAAAAPSGTAPPPGALVPPQAAPPPAASVPPPASGASQSSYRLQKGTRLYKSPLTAQETSAPAAPFGQQQPYAAFPAPAAIFNPFGGAQPTEVALFAPPASTAPVSEPSQEVPLFGAAATLFTPQAASLFAPAETAQSVPLFASSTAEATPASSSLFPAESSSSHFQTQSTEANSSTTQAQSVPLFVPPTIEPEKEAPLIPTQALPLFPQEQTGALFAAQLETKPEPIAASEQEVPPAATVESLESTETASNQDAREELAQAPTQVKEALPEASAPAEPEHGTPLFVPVPPAAAHDEASQGVPLYPPASSAAPATQQTEPPAAEAPQSLFSTNSLFGAPPPPLSTNDLFAPAKPTLTEQPSAALTTQTTTTFFNPFEQTITTPLPQELLPPPIGFHAPSSQAETSSLFAAQTIEPEPEPEPQAEPVKAAAAPPPPPPTITSQTDASSQANPFRRASVTAPTAAAAPSALLSFFTPAASSSDFGFFGSQPEATQQGSSQFPDLPPVANSVAPPAVAEEPPVETGCQATHTLGFEQLISNSQQATPQTQNSHQVYQNSSVNAFSGYFGGSGEATVPAAQPQSLSQPPAQPASGCNSANFFDHFAAGSQGQEEQRIQNFFNNPPLQDQPAAPGELKYDLVHSGLADKQFEQRSQASVSNIVEPPSSACSEFSSAAPTGANSTPVQQPDRSADYLLKQHKGELPEETLQQLRMASEKGQATEAVVYTPVLPHWFYKRSEGTKFVWTPFSHYDSALLETSLNSEESDSSSIVPVEGGRYDVNIKERTKTPVYWEGKAIEVRRCTWFYKAVDGKYVPYSEATAEALEIEYKRSTETNEWQKKIPLGNGEQVTMHGPSVIVHFMPPANADTWGATVQSTTRALVVKRDLNDFKIQQGESQRVDHLLFMVHGIGSACDLKMRNVEEVVDDFRFIAQQLVQSHYKNSTDMGLVGRVEVLPIEWHGHLHSEELGIDEKLKSITLESIPRLRNFTNDTLLDVLFYTSPKYCQKIMNTVADALNEVYLKYRMRHPEFNGGVSLAGHSLGSLILFDLLCHQEPLKESDEENKENPDQLPHNKSAESRSVQLANNDEMLPKQVSYAMGIGPAGTGQPVINYTQLIFHPKKFFALGSPIGMFVTIRGIDKLGLDFRLPTCPGFYNIFHPFDPVAYRIEALVNPDMKGIRPVLIPHHKGRKRMHLELKETMTRVGADIKQRFMDTFKTTLDSVNFLATVTKVKKEAEESLEKEVATSSSQIFHKQTTDLDELSTATTSGHVRNRTDSESTTTSDPEFIELDFPLGKLNDSKRVDYVLQEAPLEFINEYIFAISSHVCYWGSEDTILFVMKEIYAGLGISTDSQVPQQSMTIERPSSQSSSIGQSLFPM